MAALGGGGTISNPSLTNAFVVRGSVAPAAAESAVGYALVRIQRGAPQGEFQELLRGEIPLPGDGTFALPEIALAPETESVLSLLLTEGGGAQSGFRVWISTRTSVEPEPPVSKEGPVIVLTEVEPPFTSGDLIVIHGTGELRPVTIAGLVSDPGGAATLTAQVASIAPGVGGGPEDAVVPGPLVEVPLAEGGRFQFGPVALGPGEHRVTLAAQNPSGAEGRQGLHVSYVTNDVAGGGGKDPALPPTEDNPRGSTANGPLVLSTPAGPLGADENRPLVFVYLRLNQAAPPGGVRVGVRQIEGSATKGSDYLVETNEVVIAEGEYENVARLEILDDAELEPQENFILEGRVIGPPGDGTLPIRVEVRITDNELPGKVGLIAPGFVVNEASGQGEIRLARSGNHQLPGAVGYRIEGDAGLVAFLGGKVTGRVEFGVGESQAVIPVPIPNDAEVQPVRELTVRIEAPEGGMALGEIVESRVKVRDDESPPIVDPQTAENRPMDGRRGLLVNVKTERGFRYLIEYADSPSASSWTLLTTLFGNNSQQSAWDSAEASESRFYRYRVENELLTMPGD
ncbi:MAG: Calx-beta domain-containing protein [Limisphaerales bacterium]